MRSAGSAYDEIRYNKTTKKWEKVKRVTSISLGSLSWNTTSATVGHFYAQNVLGDIGYGNLLCSKYTTGAGQYANMPANKTIGNNASAPYNQIIFVRDDDYSDAATFKQAMQDVILYYELAEPIVTEIDGSENWNLDYLVWDFGTEEAMASVPSAPFRADINYEPNAVDDLRWAVSEIRSLRAQIAQLQSTQVSETNLME
jgi:hypothetical protein